MLPKKANSYLFLRLRRHVVVDRTISIVFTLIMIAWIVIRVRKVRDQLKEIVERWDRFPIPPRQVSQAACKEVILNKDFSLFRELPLFRVNPMDGGFFISKGCVIARDPENPGRQNVGIYRIQVKDHDRLGIQISAQHNLAIFLRKAEERNQPLRVAVSISNDPIIFENLYTGRPWSEIDYLQGLNTSATIYKQMKADFPEVEAVNAMYTHGYATIISSRMRFGGFAKTLGCRLLSTPHGIVYPKLIIVVDADVDPYPIEEKYVYGSLL